MIAYKSKAQCLFLGQGSDEQFAGRQVWKKQLTEKGTGDIEVLSRELAGKDSSKKCLWTSHDCG